MTNEQKLFQAIADVFRVNVESVNLDSSPDSIKKWDSLGMIQLVSELELVFDVQFELLEIADFQNVAIIKSILAEKGILF
jgi:acyl carrier protein